MIFTEIEKPALKFTWNLKELQITKTILEKKKKVGVLILADFKTFYKAKIIKTMWCWTHRPME